MAIDEPRECEEVEVTGRVKVTEWALRRVTDPCTTIDLSSRRSDSTEDDGVRGGVERIGEGLVGRRLILGRRREEHESARGLAVVVGAEGGGGSSRCV